jgi:DAK2 domain fusion protein YloV
MATLERLGPDHLKAVVMAYRDALRAHQEPINRLNVYPVPDGDTGTNMALTLESVVAGLDGAAEMADVCQAISRGSLMGARGNSGVILSQILRGIADGCRDHPDVGGAELSKALTAASAAAYAAVMRPVEGTILTVVKAAAEGAADAAGTDGGLCAVLDGARDAGEVALANTPELLPVLKQAGVVDAGGAGFQLLLDAFLHVVDARPLPEPDEAATGVAPNIESGAFQPEVDASHDSVSDLRYEVMYFLEADDGTIPHFKNVWAGIGDSIVVVGGEGLWNCHIHTDDIGAAVEAALDAGRPRSIRVTDLLEQVEEERWVREAEVPEDEPATEPVQTAVVAVATGDGIRRIFRSLGVQQIVAGGQSMNPSTEQLLAAVEAAPSDEVLVLPNNKNIIPVAEQVDALTDKTVRVVKTTGIAQGFAALLEYDPESPVDENAKSMEAAAGRVVSGEVTRAVRASTCDAGPIAEGDFLGISSAGIQAVAPALADAATRLLDVLIDDDHEIVTLIEGEGASAADTRRITEWVHDNRPEASVEVHHGGQALYPYLVSIE